MLTKLLQSSPTLCNPIDCSLPGSSVHGILQAKNTGVGCHFFLQGIFPALGLNPRLLCLLHWQVGSLPLAQPRKPYLLCIKDSPNRVSIEFSYTKLLRKWEGKKAQRGWRWPKDLNGTTGKVLQGGGVLPFEETPQSCRDWLGQHKEKALPLHWSLSETGTALLTSSLRKTMHSLGGVTGDISRAGWFLNLSKDWEYQMQFVQTPGLQIRFPRQPDNSENKTTKPCGGGLVRSRWGGIYQELSPGHQVFLQHLASAFETWQDKILTGTEIAKDCNHFLIKRPNSLPLLDSIQLFNKKVKPNIVINSQNCKFGSFSPYLQPFFGCCRKCIRFVCHLLCHHRCAQPWNSGWGRVRMG